MSGRMVPLATASLVPRARLLPMLVSRAALSNANFRPRKDRLAPCIPLNEVTAVASVRADSRSRLKEQRSVTHLQEPTGDIHWRPGYRRDAEGTWLGEDGAPVSDPVVLERLAKLAIPPAWGDVWAAPSPDDRVQARGVDSRGRTQYRYSPAATEQAARDKFTHMLHFASALPRLRELIQMRLSQPIENPDFRQVTALAGRFLDRGLFRVGSDRYVRDNDTYGLTTLRTNHVSVEGDIVTFDFVGKEHLRQHHEIEDGLAAQLTARLLELHEAQEDEGFHPYLLSVPASSGTHGTIRRVRAATLNSYIHAATGAPATAKMARTWGGTVIAAAVAGGAHFESSKHHKDPSLTAYDAAAAVLGNTPRMARTSYVHPAALEVGTSQRVREAVAEAARARGTQEVHRLFFDPELQEAVRLALDQQN